MNNLRWDRSKRAFKQSVLKLRFRDTEKKVSKNLYFYQEIVIKIL
jgi:hypothetical protein